MAESGLWDFWKMGGMRSIIGLLKDRGIKRGMDLLSQGSWVHTLRGNGQRSIGYDLLELLLAGRLFP